MLMTTIKVKKKGISVPGNIGTGEHGLGTGEHRFGEYVWSGVTNTLVKTTNILSANYIGCRTTNWIGHG